jgi:hypothetical protein
MRIIYYLYYRVYKYYQKGDKTPVFSTFSYFAGVTALLYFSLSIICNYYFKIDLLIKSKNSFWLIGLIYFLIFLIPCYFLFVHNNKHVKIIKMFKDDGSAQRTLYNVLVPALPFLCFVLMFIVMYLFDPFRK